MVCIKAMGWAGLVALVGRREIHTRFSEEDLKEDLSLDGSLLLEWTLMKQHGRAWTGYV
jgi:hypothetical protein